VMSAVPSAGLEDQHVIVVADAPPGGSAADGAEPSPGTEEAAA